VRISIAPENRFRAGKRHDEGIDARAHDSEAVEPAQESAQSDRKQEGDGYRQAEHLHQVTGEHHRADSDRPHREVHAAGCQDRHLAEADGDVHRQGAPHAEEVERGNVPWLLHREHDDQ